LLVQKTLIVDTPRREICSVLFPLDVLLVSSSIIIIPADSEHLTCGEFSLGETIRLRNIEFNADYFSGLSFTPKRGDACAALMGSTHSGASTPWRAMIEDNTE
jgi:hypothetical protein